MKIDLHVHSKFSSKPSEWILQKLRCPESFTDPMALYQAAKSRGMTHVTITDHNTIEGSLAIAHLPDTFVSVELTAYFPEDGCKVHVLVHGLTAAQFEDCQRLRRNLYELVRYLNAQGLFHAIAHPLFSVNGKLTLEHVEKLLILFEVLELNGSRGEELNEATRFIISQLTASSMARLMEKHRLASPHAEPWKKYLIGGSDDHSSLFIAKRWTEVAGASDLASLYQGVRQGSAEVKATPASPYGFARTLYSIAYQFYKTKFHLLGPQSKSVLSNILDKFLLPEGPRPAQKIGFVERFRVFFSHEAGSKSATTNAPILDILNSEVLRTIRQDPEFVRAYHDAKSNEDADRTWCRFIVHFSNKLLTHLNAHQLTSFLRGDFFSAIQSFSSVALLYFLLSPYFLSFSLFNRDRRFSHKVRKHFGEAQPGAREHRVAHFTDTFYDVNGVARSLQRQATLGAKMGKAYEIITCEGDREVPRPCVKNFKPIGTCEFPEYPDLKLRYPPFLEMLDHCYQRDLTHIHIATPGLVGLAGLGIARTLRIPAVGTYHTAFPQYARFFTDDESVEELAWKYMTWFYQQLDLIWVPSEATRAELVAKGLLGEKIRIFPRGVDTAIFSPAKRNGVFKDTGLEGTVKLLYVGRISKEKNLHLLARTFSDLCKHRRDVSLTIVGQGPFLDEMKKICRGLPCWFTGTLEGEALADVYASSDLFVFPSETDTFGNVVLEAQASGIPAVVTDRGGPCENVIHGETGWIVRSGTPDGFLQALLELTGDRQRLRDMGAKARLFMEKRSFEAAFDKAWGLYGDLDKDLTGGGTVRQGQAGFKEAFPFEPVFSFQNATIFE